VKLSIEIENQWSGILHGETLRTCALLAVHGFVLTPGAPGIR